MLVPLHALRNILRQRLVARKLRLLVVAERDDDNAIVRPLAILRDGRFVGFEVVDMLNIRLGNMLHTIHLHTNYDVERILCLRSGRHKMHNA